MRLWTCSPKTTAWVAFWSQVAHPNMGRQDHERCAFPAFSCYEILELPATCHEHHEEKTRDLMAMKNDTNYNLILSKLKQEGALHASLIDPDELKQPAAVAGRMAELADKAGTDMFFVGGSTCFSQAFIEKTQKAIKKSSNKPLIIFPGGINAVCYPADAILFLSILNSTNPYFIIGGQTMGAVAIKMSGMEAIACGYLVVAPGGAAGWMSDCKPLPRYKPEIAVGYALAAQYMGFKLIYLEAGSGADTSVPIEMIKKVKKFCDLPLIVGGGVNTPEDAREKVLAGADIIVQGTFLEENIQRDGGESLARIIQAIKEAGREKLASKHAKDVSVPEAGSGVPRAENGVPGN